jgi:pilus assembly protein CpaC
MWSCRQGYGRSWKSGLSSNVVAALAAACATGAALLAALSATQAQSGGRLWENENNRGGSLVVTLNKSRTIRMLQPFASAVIGRPEIADVLPMSDRSLYIQGKTLGTTNLSVFDENQRLINVIDVEVTVDTESLRQKIVATTGSRGIRVLYSNGQIVLGGQANDAVAADRAVAVAKGLAATQRLPNILGDGGVINAMTVANSQQVLLKVRFLEANRDAGRQLGVNWFGGASGSILANTGQTTTFTPQTSSTGATTSAPQVLPFITNTAASVPTILGAGTLAGTATGPFGTVLSNHVNRGATIDVLITALETQGSVRKLAEPNLMALSGDTAKFLAGGSIPVPTISSTSGGAVTPSITYEPYGVQLSFTPTVLANGIINLRIAPEVSELDFANAVTISGTTVPAFTQRSAETTVELRSGQSFAIAGLLQANDTRNINQIPWIGSVPVLGVLFSSKGYQKAETDLVVIVTPNLVKPAVPGQRLATPFDDRLNGNDKDFFLMGQSEVKKDYSGFVSSGGSVQGPYGHLIPPVAAFKRPRCRQRRRKVTP